jgi:hypothetical protein
VEVPQEAFFAVLTSDASAGGGMGNKYPPATGGRRPRGDHCYPRKLGHNAGPSRFGAAGP